MSKKHELTPFNTKNLSHALTQTKNQKFIQQNNSQVIIGQNVDGSLCSKQVIECGTRYSAKKLCMELAGVRTESESREQRYYKLQSHPWYGFVITEELTEKDRYYILLFIQQTKHLNEHMYKVKVAYLFLDDKDKPENHPIIQEVLSVIAGGEQ